MTSHSLLSASLKVLSFVQTTILMMSSTEPPAASMTRRTLASMSLHWLSTSGGIFRVSGSIPNIPLLIMNGPITHPIGIGFSCWSPGTSKLRRLLTILSPFRGEIPLPLEEGGAAASGLARRVRVTGSDQTCTLTLRSPRARGASENFRKIECQNRIQAHVRDDHWLGLRIDRD